MMPIHIVYLIINATLTTLGVMYLLYLGLMRDLQARYDDQLMDRLADAGFGAVRIGNGLGNGKWLIYRKDGLEIAATGYDLRQAAREALRGVTAITIGH